MSQASQAAISVWKLLFAKKSPRGDPQAGVAKWSIQRASKFMRMSMMKRRTAASIAESATKELQSLAEFMPNLADTDARTLALRLYYISQEKVINVQPGFLWLVFNKNPS